MAEAGRTLSMVVAWAVGLSLAYLWGMALAALRFRPVNVQQHPRHRFAIAIPAHNEESVIESTVSTLQNMDYPRDLFDVHVVADHCTDRTADVAEAAGAIAHRRQDLPAGSKGAALQWLFRRVLSHQPEDGPGYDAVVVFDADTQVAADFVRIMDARLSQGDRVIQGQHRIRNPEDGWFPALTWAMFLIDNRLQNLGRTNLGWSAKNMGDAICFRADVLRELGWGEGLTEDYAFRQRLLLEGIKIAYEPRALALGEAPISWRVARSQRVRWLRGTHDASHQYARQLLREALTRRDLALLDGALQAYLPSYSSLAVLAGLGWLAGALAEMVRGDAPLRIPRLLNAWTVMLGIIAAYPLVGLLVERAPRRAYLVILSGPVFILWRTWLALTSRLASRPVAWIRTPRKAELDESGK